MLAILTTDGVDFLYTSIATLSSGVKMAFAEARGGRAMEWMASVIAAATEGNAAKKVETFGSLWCL